ncbi:MAG: DUF2845 domain-containing protein [Desulfobacterota bacterium]|nr:DUF2845 domain-containing protein [Thermodesulfobacteriota bacterium]
MSNLSLSMFLRNKISRRGKIVFLLLVFGIIIGNPIIAFPDSCRCGNKLVSIGDTKSEVLNKCGPPTWTEQRKEHRLERIYAEPYYKGGESREPIFSKVEVNIEEWFYNFGPSRLMQIFRFENGKLVEIETGNYGY